MQKLVLELKDIEVSFLDRTILTIHNLKVHQFDRIGVVGKNGSGKSTLLQLLHQDLQPNKGHVNRLIDFGYFKQTESPNYQASDFKLLGQLNVPDRHATQMSGGEQTRLKLAQLFSTYHEGLLIDEPTTHLDTKGVDFLIEELMYYYGALILVSHDRFLLDQLVTKIWEVNEGEIIEYTGNYSDYERQKELERIQQQERHEKYVKEKQRLLSAADEKMKKAKKITQANQSMSKKEVNTPANRMFMTKQKDTSQKSVQRAAKALEKRVEQLDEVKAIETEKTIRFHQPKLLQLHNKFPIMADRLTIKMKDTLLFDHASFQFPLGKTIAITGSNGSGKSTLLNHILHDGEGITLSPKVVFGVYQQLDYQFSKDKTVLEFMKENSHYEQSKIRAVLHAMNFTGNDLKKETSQLSGGEAIRLKLCQLFLGSYNVLILDEPTNFLDIHSMKALETFLLNYEGTVLLVSHDREFVKRVADHRYEIQEKRIKQIY
ncbi:Msr family ABC-F type ribosomal protection protein [Metabacillus halosaccharovorans]|uniref:Msr family ABC-F type ribosomal protection protein n=1 Tax=Metabacillus halosaccharovorans TaxID=930124 RepID=UPI00403DECF2